MGLWRGKRQGEPPGDSRRQWGGFFGCSAEKSERSVSGDSGGRPLSLSAPREEKTLPGNGEAGEEPGVLPWRGRAKAWRAASWQESAETENG